MPKITREKDADPVCQVVLARGVCGTSGRWPQSSALQPYAKLQNVVGILDLASQLDPSGPLDVSKF